MAAARQDGNRDMCLTGSTGDVLAASSSAAPEEILPTPADEGIYSDDCNQAFSSRLHWGNTFTVKEEPIESPPLWTIEGHGPRAPDCMSSLKGLTEGRWRDSFLHETEEPEEVCAPSTCEGSYSETADTPSSCHDQLDEGLVDGVAVKEEIEESPPGSTSKSFCPEDYSEMSLSLVDLEGHCSGARVVKKGKLNGGWSHLYFRVLSDAGGMSRKQTVLLEIDE